MRLTLHAANEKHSAQASNEARIQGPGMSVVDPHLPPNGSRLSCGAEEKGFVQYPTRAASFKRL